MGSLHPHQLRVADKVALQLRVERTLAAQPRERFFCFMRQFHRGNAGGRTSEVGGLGTGFDGNLDLFGAGADANIHAARGDELGLRRWIGGKYFEQRDEVFIRQIVRIAAEQAADVAPRQAGLTGDVALIHLPALNAALECGAEVAHDRMKAEG